MPDALLEHHLEVSRTARYCTLGDPDRTHEEAWFVLHGYRQLARRFLRRFEAVADGRRLLVAPEGLSRFYVSPAVGRHGEDAVVGASWMTREDRENEIRDYVGYLDGLAGEVLRGGERVTVLGFSQGVATAARWVTCGTARPDRLVLWAGYVPPDLEMTRAAEALSGVELLLVRGDSDPGRDEGRATSEARWLAEAGVAYRTVEYAGGHDIDPVTLERIAEG